MAVIVIGAVSKDGIYGTGDTSPAPWTSKINRTHFKRLTTGNVVVMGRRTCLSLPGRHKPLPDRLNIVITNDPFFEVEGVYVATGIQEAIILAQKMAPEKDIYCIGGARVWCEALGIADEAIITVVDITIPKSEETKTAIELLDISSKWKQFSLKKISHHVDFFEDGERFDLTFDHYIKLKG